jgi:protocatechuate 3,4-dioxygenase beta subunit
VLQSWVLVLAMLAVEGPPETAALEQRIAADPHDQAAVRELHLLLARPNDLPREETLRLRGVLRTHPERSSATLVPPGEPGDPLMIAGTIRDEAGQPVAGALVTVFHTDAKGFYSPRDAETKRMDEPNSRLFAFIETGADGRYAFRTVRPGGYPFPLPKQKDDEAFVPQHIHFVITATGYEAFGCGHQNCQLVFADDPRMTPHWQAWARELPAPVLTLERDADGVSHATYDVTLRRSN